MTQEENLKRAERRAKRELRREKQRAANIGRAQKMHQQRMAATDEKNNFSDLPAINVGCSGWFYWHWKGQFYPEDMPTNR